MKKTIILAAVIVGVGLGAIVTRVFWDGHAALAAGDAAMAKGDQAAALVSWRRAARWYAPLAPHVAAAYARMEALAREADSRNDTAQALEAWRAIRSSALSTRSFYTPYAGELEAANQRIADLMARADTASKKPEPERRAYHLGLLERDESPSVPWTLVALAGFGAWVAGGFWLARRGVTTDDKLEKRTAARAGALIAVGLLVWMLGLYQA